MKSFWNTKLKCFATQSDFGGVQWEQAMQRTVGTIIVQKLCRSCAEAVQKFCRRCAEVRQKLCRSCAEVVQKLCRSCAEVVQKLCRSCVLYCLRPLFVALLAPTVHCLHPLCIACTHCALLAQSNLSLAFSEAKKVANKGCYSPPIWGWNSFHLYFMPCGWTLETECHFEYARGHSKSWILTRGWKS